MIAMVLLNGTYYEQMNNCEVTDGPLADHCETIVISESGPRGLSLLFQWCQSGR